MKNTKLIKSYITDNRGNIKSVILDYRTFKRIQEILLDVGLAKAMKEVEEDEEIDLRKAIKLAGYTGESKP